MYFILPATPALLACGLAGLAYMYCISLLGLRSRVRHEIVTFRAIRRYLTTCVLMVIGVKKSSVSNE